MDHLDLISIFIIAVGLSADCFAVAFSGCIAMKSVSKKQVIIASLSFGAFQALMPVLGWLAGQTVVDLIADYDHWLAFGLLAFIGGKMIWESFRKDDQECKTDITKGKTLLTLSIATSIDALAVGLTFAFLEVNIAPGLRSYRYNCLPGFRSRIYTRQESRQSARQTRGTYRRACPDCYRAEDIAGPFALGSVFRIFHRALGGFVYLDGSQLYRGIL